MCGIYGFIGKVQDSDKAKVLEIFENLGIESEIRGRHATGFYGLNGEVKTAKAPLPASQFFQTTEYKELYKDHVPSIMIGHNRWATSGDPQNNANNHPFTTNRWGFIHNGVVAKVATDVKTKTECDSEMIFRFFTRDFYNSHNAFNTIAKTLKHFDNGGDLACAMVDSKKRTLYLFRNRGRPLATFFLKKLGIFLFASTKEILKNALNMSGFDCAEKQMNGLFTGEILRIRENLKKKRKYVQGLRQPERKTKYKIIDYRPTQHSKKKKKSKKSGWQCQSCKKVFLNTEYLRRHLRKEHQIIDDNEAALLMLNTKDPQTKVSFTTTVNGQVIKRGDVLKKAKKNSKKIKKAKIVNSLGLAPINSQLGLWDEPKSNQIVWSTSNPALQDRRFA